MSNPKVDLREQTTDVKGSGLSFTDLKINKTLVESLRKINFIQATPIQEQAIPVILNGVDIVARAKNGTGKTGAFSIPLINKLDLQQQHIQAIVIAHTKELAMQISRNIKEMGSLIPNFQDKVICMVGGVDFKEDLERLKKNPIVVVGTVQRILGFVSHQNINVKRCKMFIVDEADKQVDQQEFRDDIIKLKNQCSRDVQIMLFSATFPRSIEEFVGQHLNEPEFINCMKENLTLEGITQYVANVREEKYKVKLLNILFTKLQIQQCIVFVNQISKCEPLNYMIANQLKIPSLYVHSKMDLADRSKIFHDFSQGLARVLVTTDLYTRGIDIRTVNVVINFDVPFQADDYLHRIGRCGRFGHRGLAITFMSGEREKNLFLDIDNAIKGRQQQQILNLPEDVSMIPQSIYAFTKDQLQMK